MIHRPRPHLAGNKTPGVKRAARSEAAATKVRSSETTVVPPSIFRRRKEESNAR